MTNRVGDDPIIDDALLSNDDRQVTAVVRLSTPRLSNRQSGPERVETMRENAAQTQQSVKRFATERSGVTQKSSFWLANAVVLEVDTHRVPLREIAGLPGVRRIHENVEVEAIEPVQPSRSRRAVDSDDAETTAHGDHTYGLEQIDVPAVWDEYGTGGGAKVAVLDTGIDADHDDLELFTEDSTDPTYPGGWAEFDSDGNIVEGSEPHDTGEHGTHVSGTVAGGDASGTHIGVAPDVDLMHGLVLPGGSGSWDQIIGGMQWAVDEGADIINMSLGANMYAEQFVEPLQNTIAAGTLPVSASGNDGEGTSGSPANIYEGMAVGATDENEEVTSFSSGELIDTEDAWGEDAPEHWPEEYIVPDVAAPGNDVYSAVPGNNYDEKPGTSMASPHVAGVAGLIVSASSGGVDPAEIVSILEQNAWKPEDWNEPAETIDGKDHRYGKGIVDAKASVDEAALDSGIEGTVIDTDGTQLEGVSVEGADRDTTTDENGAYFILAEPDDHEVSADGFGYEEQSETVTVTEDEVTEQNFTLDTELYGRVAASQPDAIESGETLETVLDVAHAETATVSQDGEYAESDATLEVDGTEATFDDPVAMNDGINEVVLTVETAEDTSGEISLSVTLDANEEDVVVSTGSTTVNEKLIRVGVVDESGDFDDTIADVLAAELGGEYDITPTSTTDVIAEPGSYDAVVAQSLSDSEVGDFVDTTESEDVGVVYLDQWGGDADAIPQFAAESVAVTDTFEDDNIGDVEGPVSYEVTAEHPILDGLSVGDDEVIHEGQYDDVTWFELDEDADFDVIADAADSEGPIGSALAIDEDTDTVLAATLGYSGFVGENEFTDAADSFLAGAVEHLTGTDLFVTATVTQDNVSAEFSLDATGVETLTVEDLWRDWMVTDVEFEEDFTDDVWDEGKCSWTWEGTKDSVSPTMTVDFDNTRYVGGNFVMTVRASADEETVETTALLVIE